MVDLVFNNFTTTKGYGRDFFKNIINVAAEKLGFGSKKIELSVNLVGDGRIRSLNKKYRHRNKITDVLSFPLSAGQSNNKKIKLKSTSLSNNKLVTSGEINGIIPLGDVFICLSVAKKHAKRENVSLDFKMAFLTVHGFLHLLGYDHEKPDQQKEMFVIQDQILSKLTETGS